MDIPTLDLLRRGVRALESIAAALAPESELNLENQKAKLLLLRAKVNCQIKRLGYDQDDFTKAKQMLAGIFEGKTSLKELSVEQLTEYAQTLRKLEGMKRDQENS
jgi:hypothetical protein